MGIITGRAPPFARAGCQHASMVSEVRGLVGVHAMCAQLQCKGVLTKSVPLRRKDRPIADAHVNLQPDCVRCLAQIGNEAGVAFCVVLGVVVPGLVVEHQPGQVVPGGSCHGSLDEQVKRQSMLAARAVACRPTLVSTLMGKSRKVEENLEVSVYLTQHGGGG